MPSIVTEDGSFPETIEVPDDGEGATSASLEDTFVQDLSNRTRHDHTILTVSGVPRIRSVANVAALKAATGMASGDTRYVDGIGLYFFLAGSLTPEAGIWVVAPNVGAGRWIHELAGVIVDTTSVGVATFGATGKVLNPVPNRVLNVHKQERTPAVADADEQIASSTSVTYIEPSVRVGVSSAADEVLVGDRILIWAKVRAYCAATAFVQVKVGDVIGGLVTYTQLRQCWERIAPAEDRSCYFVGEYTAGAGIARTLTVDIEFRTTSATKPVYLYKPSSVLIQIIRP